MVKGRHFKPSSDKDGSWFPHIGLTQKTPESLMSSVLKESYCPKLIQQTEKKLPPIFKVREKQAGLGRKKISPEKGQHVSRNFNLWACDFIPSYLDGLSSNQIDYVYKEATIAPNLRHFPKSYNQVWDNFRPAAQSYMKPE
ncbi:testis-expressed protein 36 isoform X2 [Octodon degus]|uniref:Testis-expressed protein 36 isoform X2 n=1 Tax=Octodon degus TaxID=10160 RepID=A0A6P6DXP4_OCTDE|nr:testis-expressed protein 36 isoform X2 [Octodon degus]